MKTEISVNSTIPAFPKDVNFPSDRPGLPYRRYGGSNFNRFGNNSNQNSNYINFQKPSDGKNPIRNCMRMLCQGWLSDERILSKCPSLTPPKKIQIVNHVFNLDSIGCHSDECHKSLDEMQKFDDDQWHEVRKLLNEEHPVELNEVHWTTFNQSSRDASPTRF